jgi:hypothetical protein
MKKPTRWLIGLSVAGVLLGNPVGSSANDDSTDATIEIVDQPIMIGTTSFCYAGRIIDPTTGEEVDLYNLCTDNLDLA